MKLDDDYHWQLLGWQLSYHPRGGCIPFSVRVLGLQPWYRSLKIGRREIRWGRLRRPEDLP